MPRIIVKCKYLKSGKHRDFYTKYMATREGAEKVTTSYGKADATAKQKEMVQSLLKDFPDAKNLFEYEDYIKEPNRENASELISTIMENNLDQIATKENYVDYIANRPRVEKLGEHGLFSDTNETIDLNKTAQEVAMHEGYVWTNIISLKREDATRLGYDNANAWRNLCRAKRNELAEIMNIEPNNLVWYAAFHNEGHHPHIHMIAYSKDKNQGYLTKNGIYQMRKIVAGTIFKQDLMHLYESKTQIRDKLKKVSEIEIKEILASMNQPMQENQDLINLVKQLYNEIQNHKGKLVYGFLKSNVKEIVDKIVTLLEQDERIQKLYDAWYLQKEDIQQTYQDAMDIRIPLHQQKEFKSIKNRILNEVKNLHLYETRTLELDEAFEDVEHSMNFEHEILQPIYEEKTNSFKTDIYKIEWSETYKEAMQYLYGNANVEKDILKAIDHLEYEVERKNVLALSELGKIYQKGIGVEIDEDKANHYYEQALDGFMILNSESTKTKSYLSYRIGKHHLYGLGTEMNYEKAIEYFQLAENNKYALYLLGMMSKRGLGKEKDDKTAFQYFFRSANQGNAYAQYETALAYETGRGVKKDEEQAEFYYKTAYEKFIEMELESGDDSLQFRLGKMCYEGKGIEQDIKLAMEHLEKAVEMKNENAKYLLAKIWIKENYFEYNELAEKYLMELVEQEHEAAAFLLGKEYMTGDFFEGDIQKAIKYLKKCKENSYAEYMLYKAYQLIQPPDISKALMYLKQSAEHDNEVAQFLLGKRLLNGEDVDTNIVDAVEWLKKSANHNNMFAQYLLGKLFLFGKEVEKDEELAIHYLETSAQQGNEYAKWLLEHKDDFGMQSLGLVVSRFFYHVSRIFQNQMLPDQKNPLAGVDKKLRRKIEEKRSALGHKKEDQSMNYIG